MKENKEFETPENFNDKGTVVVDEFMEFSVNQIRVLEKISAQCEKPNDSNILELIQQNQILSNLDPRWIHDWFEDRYIEKMEKMLLLCMLQNECFGDLVVQELQRGIQYHRKWLQYLSQEYSICPLLPRSIFESVKMNVVKKLLNSENEYLRIQVERLLKVKENLEELLKNT